MPRDVGSARTLRCAIRFPGRPRPGDILHSSADISKAREILGYEPRFPLEEGLRMLLNAAVNQETI